MTARRGPLVVAAIGGLWSIAFAAVASAHHPIPRPNTGAEWPGPLLWLLGAGVFMIAFVASWAVLAFVERRQREGSDERESARRS
jgi:hypothetical protein